MTEGRSSSSATVCAAPPGRIAEVEPGPLQQHVAGQGVAVGAQARREQADHRVARTTRSGPSWVPSSTTPTAKPARSSSSGAMTPSARRLAPDQRAARLPAALVHPAHDRGDVLGVDLARRDVVEHEQRLGTDADQVVHAHRHQVDADGLVAAGRAGHHELRADAVRRGDQHRLGEAGGVERELAAEAADAGHQRAQPLDGGVTGLDVHAGAGVGGAALPHRGQTRGARPGGPWPHRLGPERDGRRGGRGVGAGPGVGTGVG